jgi:hypothetical protein
MDRVLKEALTGARADEIFGNYGTDQDIAVDSPKADRPADVGARGDGPGPSPGRGSL